jgi:F-type H+-transporting ATPase subunit b
MHIDGWTLALQTINVLVLIWLLSRYLFRPVVAIMAARRAEVDRLLDDAKTKQEEADADRVRARAERDRQSQGRDAAIAAVGVEVEREKAALLATARAEAERSRAAAEADIAALRRSADALASARASALALDIAAKLLDRLPADVRVAGFVDDLTQAVAALTPAARADLVADGATLHLTAPRALTETEQQRVQAGLAGALGRPVTLGVEIEPGLIAGLELDAPHTSVRNSFRADLARIAEELAHHDHA